MTLNILQMLSRPTRANLAAHRGDSARRPFPRCRPARELPDSGCTLALTAQRLNAEGFRPPKRIDAFTPNAVRDLLRAVGIHHSRPRAVACKDVITVPSHTPKGQPQGLP